LPGEQRLEKLRESHRDQGRHRSYRRESPLPLVDRDDQRAGHQDREHPRIGEEQQVPGGAMAVLVEPVVHRCGALAHGPPQRHHRRQSDRRAKAEQHG
jgi:hypothetical protein